MASFKNSRPTPYASAHVPYLQPPRLATYLNQAVTHNPHVWQKATQLCFYGFYGDPHGRCRCTPEKVQRYLEKISGPLLDRIDLIVNVPRISHHELREMAVPDNRRKALSEPSEIEEVCGLDDASEKLLATAVDKLRLSARACHRILKIARTIADLENHEDIELKDLTEAIAYRRMDRYFNSGHHASESVPGS